MLLTFYWIASADWSRLMQSFINVLHIYTASGTLPRIVECHAWIQSGLQEAKYLPPTLYHHFEFQDSSKEQGWMENKLHTTFFQYFIRKEVMLPLKTDVQVATEPGTQVLLRVTDFTASLSRRDGGRRLQPINIRISLRFVNTHKECGVTCMKISSHFVNIKRMAVNH